MASLTSPDARSWYYAGPVSSFPSITPSIASKTRLSETVPASPANVEFPDQDQTQDQIPICQILQLSSPSQSDSDSTSTILTPSAALGTVGLQSQILIFQYRGKFHAVDHQCPHRSFPLSRGSIHDIEDFGIVLSTGLTCQKHGWMFDVVTGESDRGPYRLGIWDVEIREGENDARMEGGSDGDKVGDRRQEVWVRKRLKRQD